MPNPIQKLNVLAIDPGRVAGFCFLAGDGGAAVWHIDGPKGKECRAERWSGIRLAVVSALEEHSPDIVACELPLTRGQDAKECLFGDIAIIQEACFSFGTTCLSPINVETIKRHAGVPMRDKGNKDHIIKAARLMGFKVENDHEADACILADYVQGKAVREAIVGRAA